MIYVTGDTHGGIDVKKLMDPQLEKKIGKGDYLIICGDFGFIWNPSGESAKERSWLDWFEQKPWTTLFVDGNHECFPRLYQYSEAVWNGGVVHVIRPHVLHLCRGQLFEIEGKKIFTLGGASSHDRGPAVGEKNPKGWYPEEVPSIAELQIAADTLRSTYYTVDYIITHCLPTNLNSEITDGKYKADRLTDFLQEHRPRLHYEHWYCGHYHMDRDLKNRITVLYHSIIPLGSNVGDGKPVKGQARYRRTDQVSFMYNGCQCNGEIIVALPYGGLKVKDQPAYNIQYFDGKKTRTATMVPESDIIGVISLD